RQRSGDDSSDQLVHGAALPDPACRAGYPARAGNAHGLVHCGLAPGGCCKSSRHNGNALELRHRHQCPHLTIKESGMESDVLKNSPDERFDDGVVATLVGFSVVWAIVGMLVGVYLSAELIWTWLDFGQPWLSFGRLRPVHTNGVILGFGISALMPTAFYS